MSGGRSLTVVKAVAPSAPFSSASPLLLPRHPPLQPWPCALTTSWRPSSASPPAGQRVSAHEMLFSTATMAGATHLLFLSSGGLLLLLALFLLLLGDPLLGSGLRGAKKRKSARPRRRRATSARTFAFFGFSSSSPSSSSSAAFFFLGARVLFFFGVSTGLPSSSSSTGLRAESGMSSSATVCMQIQCQRRLCRERLNERNAP